MENNKFDIENFIFCFFCERKISPLTYLICIECDKISICVQCFANGKESDKHKKIHKYEINKKMDFIISNDKWIAYEELRLLAGIENCGFGNWVEISNFVGSKTSHECELFFKNNYLKNSNNQNEFNEAVIDKLLKEYKQYKEEINDEKKSFEDILGYMKNRGDFEVEFDNEAELLLSEMEFDPKELKEETYWKLKIINIYNERLVQRKIRKDFVIERGILNINKRNKENKEKSKEQIEIENLLKVFERFHTVEDHEELTKNILKEREISRTIDELKKYKSLGLENYEEIENYNLNKDINDLNYIQEGKNMMNYTINKENMDYLNNKNLKMNPNLNELESDNNTNLSNFLNDEIKLSKELNITLNELLIIKETIIRYSIKNGVVKINNLKDVINNNEFVLCKIFDFLVEKNLIYSEIAH